jgi:hypothetical protein
VSAGIGSHRSPLPRVACAGLAFLAVGCASAPQRQSSQATAPSVAPDDGDRADPCDMCVLQGDDGSGLGTDGCPAPDFRMTSACVLTSDEQGRVTRAAAELVVNAHLTSIRIVSGRVECAAAVRSALERAGVPTSRLEIATNDAGAGVSLEVGAWDRRRCAP